jgi:AcrR family transcriptional regulator
LDYVSSQPVSRHDRRKQETRSRILEAAGELFAEQGYEATKVAEICSRADVARQTFFNHFPAKRDLLLAMFENGVDSLAVNLDAACARADSTRERLALFFADTVGPALEVGPFNRDLVAQVLSAGEQALHPEHAGRISEVFLSLVQRGLERGDVTRGYPPEVLAELVEGAVVTLMRDWSARGGFDPNRRAAEIAGLVADAIEAKPDERKRSA